METEGIRGFSTLVDALYGAAMERSQWPEFLRRLVDSMKAKSAMIRVVDLEREAIAFHADYNLDPALQRLYPEHFVHIDPFLAALRTVPSELMRRGHDWVPEHELRRTEYFSDYLVPQDTYYVAGGFVANDSHRTIYFGIQRSQRQGQFTDAEIETLQLLVPHLRRSVDLHQLIVRHELLTLASDRTLDQLAIGVILLDPAGKVVCSNRRVAELGTREHGIRILNGRVFANHPSDAPRLRELIAGISESMRDPANAPRMDSLRLGHALGGGDLFLMATSLSQPFPFFGLSLPVGATLLLIGEAAQTRALDPGILKDLYGLTRAESRIAAQLAKGVDLANICQHFHLSCNTARSQLRSVFRKTGTGSQPELVSRLLAGPFFLAA